MCKICILTSFHELNSFGTSREDGHVCVCVGKMAGDVSPDVEFENRSNILPDALVCELNCLQTEALVNGGVTAAATKSSLYMGNNARLDGTGLQ